MYVFECLFYCLIEKGNALFSVAVLNVFGVCGLSTKSDKTRDVK